VVLLDTSLIIVMERKILGLCCGIVCVPLVCVSDVQRFESCYGGSANERIDFCSL